MGDPQTGWLRWRMFSLGGGITDTTTADDISGRAQKKSSLSGAQVLSPSPVGTSACDAGVSQPGELARGCLFNERMDLVLV